MANNKVLKRRVVVTGLGAITPIGNSVAEFWDGIRKGKVGIGEITKFDTTDYKVKLAAEVKDFVPGDHMDKKAARRMEAFSQYAVAAAREAYEDSINIVVEDDGVGFNVNEMDDRKDNKNPRVGVMNIQRLIRNLYGDKYGVLFQSEIGKGTIVTVCLPMRKDRTV